MRVALSASPGCSQSRCRGDSHGPQGPRVAPDDEGSTVLARLLCLEPRAYAQSTSQAYDARSYPQLCEDSEDDRNHRRGAGGRLEPVLHPTHSSDEYSTSWRMMLCHSSRSTRPSHCAGSRLSCHVPSSCTRMSERWRPAPPGSMPAGPSWFPGHGGGGICWHEEKVPGLLDMAFCKAVEAETSWPFNGRRTSADRVSPVKMLRALGGVCCRW